MIKVTVNKADEQRVLKRIDKFVNAVAHGAFIATQKASADYVGLVKSGIGVTDTPWFVPGAWKPLSPLWKAAKKAHKDEFWIETAGIVRNIRIEIIEKSLFFINLFAGIKRDYDNDAYERAAKNEYGVGLGPARPLFNPAMNTFSYKQGDYRRIKKDHKIWLSFVYAVRSAKRKVYGAGRI